MTEPGFNDQRSLHDLLDKLLAGSITESQHRDLQNRLRHDSSIRQAYFDYIDLDTDLRELSTAADGTDNQLDRSTLALASNDNANRRRGVFAKNWRRVFWLLGLAASLMLLTTFMWWNTSNKQVASEASGDAVLVQSAGGELYRDILPSVGQTLRSNYEYALTSGLIELKFPNGTEVILEAPAVLEIAAADRLIIKHGRCSVHAPPGAEGFQVITPQAQVTDLGTRFALSVTEGGETEVHVVEGAAEARQKGNEETASLLLEQREASRFSGDAAIPIAFSPSSYRGELPDRVVGFQVGMTDDGQRSQLERITVQRAGTQHVYDAGELIAIEVTYFRAGANTHCLSVANANDVETMDNRRMVLESDLLLNTGLLNPGGSTHPLTKAPNLTDDEGAVMTPGMAIRFRESVSNGPGPDVVFFELQSVVDPMDGDSFHVSPLQFAPGLHSSTVTRYDITLQSPEAYPLPEFDLLQFDNSVGSLKELLNGSYRPRKPAIKFWAIAVGIDLTDLGYAAGARVDELFIQDAMDDEHSVDPVFVAGLQGVGEEAK